MRAPVDKYLIPIFLVSTSVIAFQLVLMQILAMQQWYHFASVVISIAMLGFATAGTLITIFKKKIKPNLDWLVPLSFSVSGLLMVLSFVLSQSNLFLFDSLLVFNQTDHLWKLIFTSILLFLPFLSAAFGLGVLFTFHSGQIAKLYFANLTGSALGGPLSIILLNNIEPNKLPPLIAIVAVVSSLILYKDLKLQWLVIPLIAFLLTIQILIFPTQIIPSQFKAISKSLQLDRSRIVDSKSSAHGFVQRVTSPVLRYAPGLSLNYPGEIRPSDIVFNNGNWIGPVIETISWDSISPGKFTTMQLPYIMQKRESILILKAGTGWLALHALQNNPDSICAVELHPTLFDYLTFMQQDDLINSGRLHLSMVNMDPRNFIQNSVSKYDLITMPSLNTFGGNSGLNALENNYLLTNEALNYIWKLLKDEGVFALTVWMDYPPRYSLKVLNSLVTVIEKNAVKDPQNHIVAIKSWGTITYVVKKSQITSSEISSIKTFCEKMSFDPLLLPGIEFDQRNKFNQIIDSSYYSFVDRILTNEREAFVELYPFDIGITADDKPFFNQFIKIENIFNVKEYYDNKAVLFLELGYILILLSFLMLLGLGIVLIVIPLRWVGVAPANKWKTFLYFSGISIGFMFIEIALIQKSTLYLENPLQSAAIIISSLLLFSGLGSYYTGKWSNPVKGSKLAFIAILIMLVLIPFLLDIIFTYTIHLALATKLFIVALIIGPLAFFMGMPFPLGIRLLDNQNDGRIPWAWGVNGFFSVISTVVATIVAVEWNFSGVFILSILAYFASGLNRQV